MVKIKEGGQAYRRDEMEFEVVGWRFRRDRGKSLRELVGGSEEHGIVSCSSVVREG